MFLRLHERIRGVIGELRHKRMFTVTAGGVLLALCLPAFAFGIEKEKIEVELKANSIEQDLKVKMLDASGTLITGKSFELSVIGEENGTALFCRDDDKDGVIYLEEVEPGNYLLQLRGSLTLEPEATPIQVEVREKVLNLDDDALSVMSKSQSPLLESTVEYVSSSRTEIQEEHVERVQEMQDGKPVYIAAGGEENITGVSSLPSPCQEAVIGRMPSGEVIGSDRIFVDGGTYYWLKSYTSRNVSDGVPTPEPEVPEKPESEKEPIVTPEPPITPTPTTEPDVPMPDEGDKTPQPTPSVEPTQEPTADPEVSITPAPEPEVQPEVVKSEGSGGQAQISAKETYPVNAGSSVVYDYTRIRLEPSYVEQVVKSGTGRFIYTGWQFMNGKQYYYDKNGHRVTGDQIIQGVQYHFGEDGVSSTDARVGIDVSRYQGTIDWKQVKNAGVRFAIIRAGYRGYQSGELMEDVCFRQNMDGANQNGIGAGVYFFTQAVNEQEAVEEAQMVLDLVKPYVISYPIVIDTERVNGSGRADKLGKEQRTAVCNAFCRTIEEAGYTPMIYASSNWFKEQLNSDELPYAKWVAHYGVSAPSYGGAYHLWQYTSDGRIDGITGRVDLNISYMEEH